MRKLFKERKLIKGGNYMRKYGNLNLLKRLLEILKQMSLKAKSALRAMSN